MFGICLGHQLTALAAGRQHLQAEIRPPGREPACHGICNGAVPYITSQNHGYAVDGDTLREGVGQVSYVNANDGTCEGVDYSRAERPSPSSSTRRPAPAPRIPTFLFDRVCQPYDESEGE